jgi:hypothetical protein
MCTHQVIRKPRVCKSEQLSHDHPTMDRLWDVVFANGDTSGQGSTMIHVHASPLMSTSLAGDSWSGKETHNAERECI